MINKKEKWKSVKGYEGIYEVSSFGQVRSLERKITKITGNTQSVKSKILTPYLNQDGYVTVKLSKFGKSVRKFVHVLVAEAFLEKPNADMKLEVNHIDYNRQNNDLKNLEWVTHAENVKHSANIGKYKHYGKSNSNYGNTKLKNFFETHPEEKAKLARKGEQNGRCKPIRCYFNELLYMDFKYVGECIKYLKSNGYISEHLKENGVRDNIRLSIKEKRCYKNLKFKYLEKV